MKDFVTYIILVSLIGIQLDAFAAPPSAPRIINTRQTGLSYAIQFQSRAEGAYIGQASTDLADWGPVGSVIPMIPGFYEFRDGDAVFFQSRFYRIGDQAPNPNPVPRWEETYPIEPLSGQETGMLPNFEWQPFLDLEPGPGPARPVLYELNIYEFRIGSGGQLIPTGLPLMTVGGIPEPNYQFEMAAPVLRADRVYAYNVNAFIPETSQFFVGNSVFFHCLGSTSQPDEWKRLFELVRVLNGELADLQSELAENDLVKEAKLVEQLVSILQNPELFREYLLALLNGELDTLKERIFSLESMIKLLDQFANLIDYLRTYGKGLSEADKNLLKLLGDRVKGLRDLLEKDGKTVSEAWDDFAALVEDIKTSFSDPAAYIKSKLQEALAEQLKKQLVDHVSKKAAGALVSIALDVLKLGDAVVLVYEISVLAEQANKILITAANGSSAPVAVSGRRETSWTSSSAQDHCTVTLSYEKLCFTKDGEDPYKGGWDKSPVPFDDGIPGQATGPPSMTRVVGTLDRAGNKRVLTNSIDPDGLKCPAGGGPCLVYLVHTLVCDGAPTRVRKTFIGVIKCP